MDWIAVDWGTTHLRAWGMSGSSVTQATQSADGMGSLDRSGFEPALLKLVSPWLDTPTGSPVQVVACGMVGSRQGWVEAPYIDVPAGPLSHAPVPAPVQDPRLSVWVVPGLKQTDPADVMRGEETQIAGFLSLNAGFDGVLCLPGTHTKWVHVSAGEVISFQTFMTGEIFALLRDRSVLRHTVADSGWDEEAFINAVDDSISRPERLATRLFALRAEALLADLEPGAARARLSGLLIGAELAGARAYWLGQPLAIIGAGAVCKPYHAALSHLGCLPMQAEADAMTRAGLHAAHALLNGEKK